MRLPATVRVGAQRYKIVKRPRLGSLGEFDFDSGEIRLRSRLDELAMATTLLHELIHAIADTMGGRMKESQVRCIEQGLGVMIQDNPEFMSELVATIAKGGQE